MPISRHAVAPNKGATFFLQPHVTRLCSESTRPVCDLACATVGAAVAQGFKKP